MMPSYPRGGAAQQMSQGALAALRRAVGSYGQPQDFVGQMMQRGVDPATLAGTGAAAGGIAGVAAAANAISNGQPGSAPAPAAAQPQAPAPAIQPQAPSVSPGYEGADPMSSRAQRILREAQLMGDASPATIRALTDELFSWLPETQRDALVQQAVALAGGVGVQPSRAAAAY